MRLVPLTLLVVFMVTAVSAHGPTPQKVLQSVVIAAKPETVWAVAGDFAGIGRWHPDVAGGEGSGGNAAGARRTLTLRNGGVLQDSLDEWDAARMTYSFRLSEPDLKALPVSSYSATLTVRPEGDGAKVEWLGRFYRGDTGNEPPEELSDEAGKTAMNRYFGDGLKGLKAKVEGR